MTIGNHFRSLQCYFLLLDALVRGPAIDVKCVSVVLKLLMSEQTYFKLPGAGCSKAG